MFQCSPRLAWALHVSSFFAMVRNYVVLPQKLIRGQHCSKWFLDKLGHQGLNNLLAAYEDKSAEAVCTFAYSPGPGHKPIIFQGRTPVSRNAAFAIQPNDVGLICSGARVGSYQLGALPILVRYPCRGEFLEIP